MPELTVYGRSVLGTSGPGTFTNTANALGAPDTLLSTTATGKTTTLSTMTIDFDCGALPDGGTVSIVKYGGRMSATSTAGAEQLVLKRADGTVVETQSLDVVVTGGQRDYEFTSATLMSVAELKAGAKLDCSSRSDTANFKSFQIDAVWLKVTYAPPAATSRAQRWDGSAWQAAPVQRWDAGSGQWVTATVKRWDGAAWV
jgi:hypothetical protein